MREIVEPDLPHSHTAQELLEVWQAEYRNRSPVKTTGFIQKLVRIKWSRPEKHGVKVVYRVGIVCYCMEGSARMQMYQATLQREMVVMMRGLWGLV